MSTENASRKIVQLLIDLMNMAKWLMYENQQLSVTQELGRLFPSIRCRRRRSESSELLRVSVGGRRSESSELLRVSAGESSTSATDTNNTSFATWSTPKRTIGEISGSKATSKKPLESMSHKTISRKIPCNFAILSRVLKPSDFRFVNWFMSFLHGCSSKQKMSCFEPFQSSPTGI